MSTIAIVSAIGGSTTWIVCRLLLTAACRKLLKKRDSVSEWGALVLNNAADSARNQRHYSLFSDLPRLAARRNELAVILLHEAGCCNGMAMSFTHSHGAFFQFYTA